MNQFFIRESEEMSRSMLHAAVNASVIPKVLKVP